MHDFFEFFRQVLILLVIISVYWPLTIPLAALAYKVRLGAHPVPLGFFSYWLRAAVASGGMAVIALSLTGFDALMTTVDVPAGLTHVVVFLAFIPLGAWWMFTAFALEDFWEGLSTLLLFVFLPGLVLVLLKLLFEVDMPHPLQIREWIAPVPTTTT
jgi:hypothetical protein